MTGAVSGVPAEAIEAAARAAAAAKYGDVAWTTESESYRTAWREKVSRTIEDFHLIAGAVPALREGIAAEVLRPVRELADGWASKFGYMAASRELLAALSAPVQAAERTTRHGHPIGDESLGQCTAKHFLFGRCHLVPHPAGTGHSIEHPFDSGHWVGFNDAQVVAQAAEEVGGATCPHYDGPLDRCGICTGHDG